MLQPIRLGGLALGCALATATLVLVTVLASNLVLSTVAALGGGTGSDARSATDPPAAAVLLSAERDGPGATDRCARWVERDRVDDGRPARDRCGERRADGTLIRP